MAADFRSDTLTKPTPAMRDAMARAEVGDDVFGEDPTIQSLEAEAAAALGFAAAVYVPSGTMANQIAIHVHCRPGDELICEERSHVYQFEGGSMARLSGTQARLLAAADGFPTPDQLAPAMRRDDVHYPRSRLLVIENTHNMAGGRVLRPAAMQALVAEAGRLGLRVHVDGARIGNAAVAAGCGIADLTRGTDSVSMCLSKGLGAPVGSLLAGSADFVREARRARKAFGGGMRQAGVLAAAGLLALREGLALLAVDHARARRMAQAFAGLPGLGVDLAAVETNILMVDLRDAEASALLTFLVEREVRALAVGPRRIRFVTHRDLTDADEQCCVDAVTEWATLASHSSSRTQP
ncbi:MAG: GntG family PLP-dependent aldolase [Planctomycetota bacterium]